MTHLRTPAPGRERLRPRRSAARADLLTVAAAALFVAAVAVAGILIQRSVDVLYVEWPPLYAHWMPHAGPGTVAAPAVAAAVIVYGPVLARRLPWRRLLLLTWAASLAWTLSLALIDGWRRGVAGRLTAKHEYLLAVDRIAADPAAAVRTFTDHILLTSPDYWPAHVAGHPPGAVLTFVGLDRIGLGGGAWAAVWVLIAGSSAAAAVLVTLRAVAGERWARRAAPFAVLAPAAVWAGVSADAYFSAVAAWGIALLALACRPAARRPAATALAAGLLLGLTVHLSYGLVLMVIPAAAVLLHGRTVRPLLPALAGVAAVTAAFTAAGFWWYEGYDLLVTRYYQGVARIRPYSYWFFGNLANAVIIAGAASVAGLRRALAGTAETARRLRSGRSLDACGVVLLALAGLCMIAAADLSGMSKAETERIWLPFALWLLPAAALLPARHHRRWLVLQAVTALFLNHVLLTGW
ncbi:hypothetical protein [Streptomyces xinghaiensis]|uniref:hypothetical protein n=1 Tax=Streptomyces xinghaiensis TaxID=1038928 RepID=UPI003F4CB1C0